ncbi:MAG: hypothetical protein C5B57_10760 [Blastocatellia bacterium]|nr:MAG: hypothetical protein C5B57_10760 [Blastocatellia bacterium]
MPLTASRMLRFFLTYFLTLCLAAFLVTGCGGSNTPSTPSTPTPTPTPPALSITPATTVLMVGQTQTYSATKSDSSTETVTWSSTDSGVLPIDANGNAVALAKGAVTITATSTNDSTLTATLNVQVVPAYQGNWSGITTMTACTDTNAFATNGYCSSRVGGSQQLVMSLTQSNLGITGTITKIEAGGQVSGSVTGSIGTNGDITQLTGTLSGNVNGADVSVKLIAWDSSATGTTMTGTWATNVTSAQMNGNVTEQWSFPGIPRTASATPAGSRPAIFTAVFWHDGGTR